MAEQEPPPAAIVVAPPVDIEVFETYEPPEPPKQRAARAAPREEQLPLMDLEEIIETDPSTVGVQYDCAKCGFRQPLRKSGDIPIIMCTNCEARMLYKVRPRSLVQFAAR
mmetsp:Transcript_21165/g.63174  ORF Transcript_21165/g.63174 Transcript_21165/m.63174 type:complete len:110 (-) Transcript_21165:68-397(-)